MFYSLPNPLDALHNLQKSLDRVSQAGFLGGGYGHQVFPPVNVFKSDHGFVLKAEMPGFRKEQINIEIKDNRLRLHGERSKDFSQNEVSLHRSERPFGKFDRTIQLPFMVDPDKTEATYDQGILTVSLQEHEVSKARRITIS